MRERYDRVSVERIVAGPGFSAIYQFLVDSGWAKESTEMAARLAGDGDANAEISRAGSAHAMLDELLEVGRELEAVRPAFGRWHGKRVKE